MMVYKFSSMRVLIVDGFGGLAERTFASRPGWQENFIEKNEMPDSQFAGTNVAPIHIGCNSERLCACMLDGFVG